MNTIVTEIRDNMVTKADLREEIGNLRTEFKVGMVGLETDMKWIRRLLCGIMIGVILQLAGVQAIIKGHLPLITKCTKLYE